MRCGFNIRRVPVTGDLILDVNGTDTFIRYDASIPARACGGLKPGSSVPVVRRPSAPRGRLLAKVPDWYRSHRELLPGVPVRSSVPSFARILL